MKKNGTCYWQHVCEENCETAGGNYKIGVPKEQRLGPESCDKIIELASPVVAASDYTIISEEDISHGLARRIQLKAVVHPRSKALNKPTLAAIVRHVFTRGLESDYARDELSRAAHRGRTPDVVWGLIYLREADEQFANWVCSFEWISPDLELSARPSESIGEYAGENLKIEWKMEPNQLVHLIEGRSLSKNEYLMRADECLAEAPNLLQRLAQIIEADQVGVADPAFVRNSEQFDHHMMDVGPAPYECQRLDEKLTSLSALVGNAGLVLGDWHSRKPAQVLHLLKTYSRDANKAFAHAQLLREDLK